MGVQWREDMVMVIADPGQFKFSMTAIIVIAAIITLACLDGNVKIEVGQYWQQEEWDDPFDMSPPEVRLVIDVKDGYVLYESRRSELPEFDHIKSLSMKSFKLGMELSDE